MATSVLRSILVFSIYYREPIHIIKGHKSAEPGQLNLISNCYGEVACLPSSIRSGKEQFEIDFDINLWYQHHTRHTSNTVNEQINIVASFCGLINVNIDFTWFYLLKWFHACFVFNVITWIYVALNMLIVFSLNIKQMQWIQRIHGMW